jgi:hypothetical protein
MDKLSKAGYVNGDMSPHVSDYQKPMSAFAESQYGTTTDYIARQDRHQEGMAKDIKKQSYKGRYS